MVETMTMMEATRAGRRVLVAQEMGVQADKAVQEEMAVDKAVVRLVAVLVEHQETITLLVEARTRTATVTSSQRKLKTKTATMEWTTLETCALS
jgi:hypothetical protein